MNKTLKLDPKTDDALERLADKKFSIKITGKEIPIFFTVSFQDSALKLLPGEECVDLTIQGPLLAFLSLLLSKDPHKASQQGLKINGDLMFAADLQSFLFNLEIDWEECLAGFMPDSMAFGLGRFVRSAHQYRKRIFSAATESMVEYLQEEKKLIPAKPLVEEFFSEVDFLYNQVERLEARLNLLAKVGISA